MSGSGARSASGCHTCRLRKKKCDELHPACRNCLERSIPCYGYGAKPAWMDGKGGEAEYVKAIRKAAERNYRARRRGWRPVPTAAAGATVMPSSLEQVRELMRAGSMEEDVVGPGACEMEMVGVRGLLGGKAKEGIAATACQAQEDRSWSVPHGAGADADQLMLGHGGLGMSPQFLGMCMDDFSISPAHEAPLSLRSKARGDEKATTAAGKMTSASRARPSPASKSCVSGCAYQPLTQRSQRSPSPHPLDALWWQSNFASNYNVRDKAELGLLMHYLDNVFGLQFGFSCLKTTRSRNLKPFGSLAGSMLPSPSNPGLTGTLENSPDRGRGWYLTTLLKCRPLYSATLSISAWHQYLVKEADFAALWAPASKTSPSDHSGWPLSGLGKVGVGLSWEAEKNFMITLKGLQGTLDEVNKKGLKGVELLRARWMVLGTMCQVLSLEVFRTLSGSWPIHIRAARTFLSMIGSSSFTPSSSSNSTSATRSSSSPRSPSSQFPSEIKPQGPEIPPRLDILEQVLMDNTHQILTSSDITALKHFVTTFIWVDILSRASGIHPSPGPRPSQAFDYLPLLENNTLDLSHVMGCENWVFLSIAQILLLQASLPSSSLSIPRDPQLAGPATGSPGHDPNALGPQSRATVLEVMLERGLRDLLSARRAETMARLELHSSLVTELFALAALTFLHVAVSGAYPFLPQVRSSVARTLDALERLPAELLVRVSWPFAVTGCMVLEEGREGLRRVVESAQNGGWNVGTVWKGMVLVEECWRLRGQKGVGEEVSWVHAMESLGEKILLC